MPREQPGFLHALRAAWRDWAYSVAGLVESPVPYDRFLVRLALKREIERTEIRPFDRERDQRFMDEWRASHKALVALGDATTTYYARRRPLPRFW